MQLPTWIYGRLSKRSQGIADHLPYVAGDGAAPALIGGVQVILTFYYLAVFLPGAVPLWFALLALVLAGASVSSGGDVMGFAKQLKGIPGGGDKRQVNVVAAELAQVYKSDEDETDYVGQHTASTLSYRFIQTVVIDILAFWLPVDIAFRLGYHAGGEWAALSTGVISALAVGLAFVALKWSGATDDLYHLLQGNSVPVHDREEPWTAWKPWGMVKRRLTRSEEHPEGRHATARENAIQSVIGVALAVASLVAVGVWLG